MKTSNHTKLLQAICDLGDDFSSKKSQFSPDFFNEVQSHFSELEQIVARELFSLTGGNASADLTNKQSTAPAVFQTTPEPTLSMSELITPDKEAMEAKEAFLNEPSEWTHEFVDNPVTHEVSEPSVTVPTQKEPMESVFGPEISDVHLEEDIPSVPEAVQMPTPVQRTPLAPEIQREPEGFNELKNIVTKTGPTEWRIPKGEIICHTQDVLVKRDTLESKIRFSISPLKKVFNGTVPILVNAEYVCFDTKQNSTAMTEGSDILLLMEVDLFTFLIKGSFVNGVFESSIMSAERSIEAGDIIECLGTTKNDGTEPVPCIELQPDSSLWISFDKSFFGMTHSGEWNDELNDNHEVMIPVAPNDNYEELRLTQTENEWIIKL